MTSPSERAAPAPRPHTRSDVYVWITDRRDTYVARTVELTVNGARTGAMADLDVEGNIIGYEMLNVDTVEIDGRPADTTRKGDLAGCGRCRHAGRWIEIDDQCPAHGDVDW